MIQDADLILRKLLAEELSRLPDTLIEGPDQITFHPPETADSVDRKKPALNLYLFDMRENLALRDETFHRERVPVRRDAGDPKVTRVGKRPAPVRLDLSYLLTAHAGADPATEHRLLSDALGALLRNPLVDPGPAMQQAAGREEMLPLTVIQPDHPAYSDPAGLWTALGGRLRPAISLVLTIPFNPFETKWTQVVREAIIGIGQGTPPFGPRRPLDFAETRVSAAGVVTDSEGKKALSGVTVTIEGLDQQAATDDRGFFFFLNLAPGAYRLHLNKRGFREHIESITAPPPGRPDALDSFVVALQAQTDPEMAAAELTRENTQNALVAAPGLVEAGRKVMVSLTGVLRWTDGRPAAFVPLRVGSHRTSTDLEGVYCFSNLAPPSDKGGHKIVADVPGRGEVEIVPENATATVAGYWEAGSDTSKAKEGGRKK